MVITSKLRRHKVMERAMRALMGNNLPPRFKFKDTYDSIEVPTTHQQHLPSQATLEAKFDELIAEEDVVAPTTQIKADMVVSSNLEVGTSNLFVDTETGNVGIGTTSPGEALHIYRNDANPTYMHIVSDTSNRAGIALSEDKTNKNVIIEYDGTGSGVGNYLAFYSGISSWVGKGAGLNYVPANGHVGIGTSSPSYKLDVAGTSNAATYYQNGVELYAQRRWEVDLTGQSTSNFYPVELKAPSYEGSPDLPDMFPVHFKVFGESLGGGSPYNESTLVGYARGGGWSDHRHMYDVHYKRYSGSEKRFEGLYRGTQDYGGGIVIYMRGGYRYSVLTDATEVNTYTSAQTLDNSVFAIKDVDGGDVSGTSTAIGRIVHIAGTNESEKRFMSGNLQFDGNVGIGTASPATKLHVEHYGSAIGDFEGIRIANHATNLHATSRPAYEFVVSDINSGTGIGHGKFAIGYRDTTSASRTDRLVIDNSGNVGIGTASPQNSLHLFKSGNEQTSGLFIEKQNVGTGTSQITFGVNGSTENVGVAKAGIFFQRASFNGRGDLKFCIDNVNDANSVGVSDAAMTIYRDGNVGIGTATVPLKFEVHDSSAGFAVDVSNSGGPIVGNHRATADSLSMISLGSVNICSDANGNSTGKNIDFRTNSFSDGGTLLMRIQDDGNVGIGTASPGYKLDVNGTLRATTGTFSGVVTMRGQQDNADGSDRAGYWNYDNKVALVLEPAANDGAVAILFPSQGNKQSDFAYIVYDEDYGEAGVSAGENGALILGCENDGGGSSDHVRVKSRLVVEADQSSSDPTNAFQVKSSNTTSDLFTVTRSGRVGIGKTNPGVPLDIKTTGNYNGIGLLGSSSGRYTLSTGSIGNDFIMSNGSYSFGRWTQAHHYDVYSTSSFGGSRDFYLNYYSGASVRLTGGTYVSSDDRIKTEERYIENATETLLKLKPQIYLKGPNIGSTSNVSRIESGLIAQDVYYDAPELRHLVSLADDAEPTETKPYTDDDPQNDPDYSSWGSKSAGLEYEGLIAYLIKSNQELYTEIQAEKARNDALEARNDALEARIAALENP